jgi:hypothetical protein
LKKNASLPESPGKDFRTLRNFVLSERQCKETNDRLNSHDKGKHFVSEVERAQSYIKDVLGPITPFLNSLEERIRVTAGASSTRTRRESLPYLKVRRRIPFSTGCAKYGRQLLKAFGFKQSHVSICDNNRVTAVPKNWKINRMIACEPEGNLSFQLAFDQFAKERLKRHGIDLSNQSLNQELARLGSIDAHLCTIDFKNASDTVAENLVWLLFPWEWACLLSDFRCPVYKMGKDGRSRIYEKFSSMGNGSTFCIETLIFASIAYAIHSKEYSVYGDDVIIESRLFEEYEALASYLGFTINADKTHYLGYYRESCGKHWFQGTDVTPLYIRTNGINKPDLCLIVNDLAQIGFPFGSLWDYAQEIVNNAALPLVPFNGSPTSGVFVDTPTAYQIGSLSCSGKDAKSYQCVTFKVYLPKADNLRVYDYRTYILWHLNAKYLGPDRRREIITSTVTLSQQSYVRRRVVFYPEDPRRVPNHIHMWSEHITR